MPGRLALSMVAVVFATALAAASARAAPPSFRLLLAPGIAPCALHVDATQFPLFAGTVLTARYQWGFGDPGGEYNRLDGFVAAHLFERAGQYRITLTVTDQAGFTREATTTVTISPPNRRDLFVSPDGDDSGPGNRPETPLRTIAAAMKKIRGDDFAVLFQAGQTHVINDSLVIEHHNIRVGRYGIGPDPILMRRGKGDIITAAKGCDALLIEHLTFDTPHAVDLHSPANKVGVDAIGVAGRNIVVRDCTFLNVDDGVNANGDPTGLLVQDCRAPLINGLRAYCVWGQGADHCYLGNFVANSTREHCIRMFGLNRVLIAYNDLTNLDRTKEGDPSDWGYYKGCIECQRGSYYYVAHNRVADGQIRVGPLGVTEPPGTATDWAVIDGNTIHRCHINAYAGADHVMMRNNLIDNDNAAAIDIAAPDVSGRRICSDFTIASNTAVNNGNHGAFLAMGGHVDGIALVDNLMIAPHWNAHQGVALNVAENDLSSFTTIAHNVWPAFAGQPRVCSLGGIKGQPPVDAEQWKHESIVKDDAFADITLDRAGSPIGDAGLLNAGVSVPGVWADHFGRSRPGTAVTIGAVQLPARQATTTTAP